MKDSHGYEIEPKVFISVCEHCGCDMYARRNDILDEQDWTDSIYYGKVSRKSLICPECGKQNTLETKELDGTIRKFYRKSAGKAINGII